MPPQWQKARNGLLDEHAEPVHDRMAALARGGEQPGLERDVDEIGHRGG